MDTVSVNIELETVSIFRECYRMGKPKVGMTVPVALDQDLLSQIENLANQRGEAKSTTMRAAIRAGLPLVQLGQGAEPVPLDSELRADVANVAKWHQWSLGKVLSEAVRAGLHAVHARWAAAHPEGSDEVPPEVLKETLSYNPDAMPLARDFIQAKRRARWLSEGFEDLKEMVPEAAERVAAIERLWELQGKQGGGGVGLWPLGVSTAEIRGQIKRLEAKRDAWGDAPTQEKGPVGKTGDSNEAPSVSARRRPSSGR